MSASFVSPGVYFREIDLSLYIPTLSSTIFAVVGTSPKGPVNTPTKITNVAAFTSTFGNPHPNHLAMYSALQYLRYGKQLVYVRVNGNTSAKATASMNGAVSYADVLGSIPGTFNIHATAVASTTGTNEDATVAVTSSDKFLLISVDGSSPVLVTLVEGATEAKATIATAIDTAINGIAGDCTVVGTNQIKIAGRVNGSHARIDILPTPNNAYTLLGLAAGTYYGVDDNRELKITSVDRSTGTEVDTTKTVTLTAGAARTAAQIVSDINTELDLPTALPITATVLDNKIRLVHDTVGQYFGIKFSHTTSSIELKGAAATLGLTEGTTTFGRGLSPASATLVVSALAHGVWGNYLSVKSEAGSATGTFRFLIYDNGLLVERFDNLVGEPSLANLDTGLQYFEDAINAVSKYITVEDTVGNTGHPVAATYTLSGGVDGLESISEDDFVGTVSGNTRTGLQTLSNAEELDVNVIAVPGVSTAAVVAEMLTISSTRGDCMCLVDPPLGLGMQQVIDWHNGAGVYSDHAALNSSYGALYWPWGKVYDAFNDQYVWTPPAGHVAAVYAYNDAVSEPWFAPAGINRGTVLPILELEFPSSRGDWDFLYGNGNSVNPIVKFPKDGIVIWGQRTLQRKPTALDRVNVRRLILYLRKVLASSIRAFVFEPNDQATWRQFVGVVAPYMESIKARRGVYDYSVVCDETTNTPDLIDQNIMAARIYMKPTKAAEIVQVDLVLTNTGAVFSEIVY